MISGFIVKDLPAGCPARQSEQELLMLKKQETETRFREAFSAIAGNDSSALVIHSALWSFGHHFEGDLLNLPLRLLTLMREAVGANRTLVFPTYSFSFCQSSIYDIATTKSEVGVLTEQARHQPGAIRSRQPIYSYAFLGPDAQVGQTFRPVTAWGEGSAMAWMQHANTRQVMLGLDWHHAAAIIHRAEELEQVPYRYYKRFPGKLLQAGLELGPTEEIFFVRPAKVRPVFDYLTATSDIRVLPSWLGSTDPEFPMQSAQTSEIVTALRKLLEADPYAFVQNREEIVDWQTSGRAAEIQALTAEQRWR
jgi:aminoglycoside 3-N-acetyltransferase